MRTVSQLRDLDRSRFNALHPNKICQAVNRHSLRILIFMKLRPVLLVMPLFSILRRELVNASRSNDRSRSEPQPPRHEFVSAAEIIISDYYFSNNKATWCYNVVDCAVRWYHRNFRQGCHQLLTQPDSITSKRSIVNAYSRLILIVIIMRFSHRMLLMVAGLDFFCSVKITPTQQAGNMSRFRQYWIVISKASIFNTKRIARIT